METEGTVLNRRFFCALVLALMLAAGLAEAANPPRIPVSDYVRLHVVADGDDAAAQALKLQVRDACLDCARALLADCADADAAWTAVNENLDALSTAASERARACGWYGAVRAEAGVFDFPDRWYGGRLVPAGEYRALRVVIGSGAGRNWWCVLYPSLCMPEDYVPGEPVHFHSTVLRWLRRVLGGGEG